MPRLWGCLTAGWREIVALLELLEGGVACGVNYERGRELKRGEWELSVVASRILRKGCRSSRVFPGRVNDGLRCTYVGGGWTPVLAMRT